MESDCLEDFLCLEERHDELLDDRFYLVVLGDVVFDKEQKIFENAIVSFED